MPRDEFVIVQMRISAVHAVDFLALTWAEGFVPVEAANAFEHALPSQHVVETGNAAGVPVRRVEKGGVRVGDFDRAAEQLRWNRLAADGNTTTFRVKLDRAIRPHRPVTEQAPDDGSLDRLCPNTEAIRRQKIDYDGVVVARVERDIFAARFSDGADHIKGLVAVEGRDFNGDNVFDFREAAPERIRQDPPTNGGLKVKADERNDFPNCLAMSDEFILAGGLERAEAEKPFVKTQFANE